MARGSTPTPPPAPTRQGDRLRGWLLSLPALVLCSPWPGVMQDVPTNVSAAAGWTLLLALPALLVTALQVRGSWKALGLVPAAFGAFALLCQGRSLFGLGDVFEAERTSLSMMTAAALVLAGARLGPEGRKGLIEGLLPVPLLVAAGSFLTNHPGAMLGNAGDAAEAALPAAVLGIFAFTSRRGFPRALALAGLVAYGIWAGISDSRLASVGFGALALLLVLPNARKTRPHEIRIALVIAGVLAGSLGLHTWGHQTAATPAVAASQGEGGLAFRRLLYGSTPTFFAAYPMGVGPGQVARDYPPFRDSREISVSEHQRLEPTPVDVEHLHQDSLQLIAEQGWLIGGALVLLLGWIAAQSFAALRRTSSTRAACGLGVLAFLGAGLINAPLMAGVAAPAVALPLLGALIAPNKFSARSKSLGPEGVILLLALALAQPAWEFVQHGRALGELGQAKRALELTKDETSMRSGMQVAREAIDRALLARSFSVDALAQSARLGDLPPEQSNRVLRRILSLRPHRRAALMDLANSQARMGNLQEAHDLQEQLRGLDPGNPVLCRNALLLALDRRKPQEVRTALTATQTHQAASEQDLRRLMQRNQLQGRSASSAPLWEALGEGNDLDNPDEAFAAADRANKRDAQIQADALLTLAHRGYAQRALDRGDLGGALRSLRQALRASARGLEALAGSTGTTSRGAEALRIELAGVLAADGQLDAARGELQGLKLNPQDILGLHPTAGDALLSQGLLPSLQGAPR